jgi:multisubunit Na+/H+ antiporter MnhB subunit
MTPHDGASAGDGARVQGRGPVRSVPTRDGAPTTVLTRMVARLLLAPSFMVAAAVLVKGYADTGDGFSAATVAALAVLLQYVAFGQRATDHLLPVRLAPTGAFVGLGLALLVGFVPVARGEAVLTHFPRPGAAVVHLGTLELLTAVLFDVGVFLLVYGMMVGAIGMIARTRPRRER